MGSNNVAIADAKFLLRVVFALIGLTVITGVLAGVTTVQAMSARTLTCMYGCQ
jgi:hypothetical protein